MGIFSGLRRRLAMFDQIQARLERVQQALGRIESRQLAGSPAASLHASEFSAFSQWGEDGIIQRLIREVPGLPPVFVEFVQVSFPIRAPRTRQPNSSCWSATDG